MSIERGSLLYQTGRHDLAEQEFRSAVAAEPNNALAHAMIALCLVQRKEYAEATQEARQAIQLRPDWDVGYSSLAYVLSARERLKEAVAAIEEAIRLDPFDPAHHALLAQVRLKQRNWPAALSAADAGLRIEPEHAACVNARGIALVNLGRRDEASATIEGALGRNPHNAQTHANQGWALLHKGDHKAALNHFREALRIDPELQWAKAGIVEALKARNIIYRVMLKYFLFMARLGRRAQWGIILGGYFGFRGLKTVADQNPALAPWVWPILIVYIIFAYMTWLAAPLFNLMLRLDRYGRYALSRDQRVASNWLAVCFLSSLTLLGIMFARNDERFLLPAIAAAIMAIPISAVFNCPTGWPRRAMAGYAALLALLFLAVDGSFFILPAGTNDAVEQWRALGQNAVLVGLVLTGFVANALIAARVKK